MAVLDFYFRLRHSDHFLQHGIFVEFLQQHDGMRDRYVILVLAFGSFRLNPDGIGFNGEQIRNSFP